MFDEVIKNMTNNGRIGKEVKDIETSAVFAIYHELLQQLLSNEDTAMPVELREAISTAVVLGRLVVLGPQGINAVEAETIGLNKPKNYPF
jgi:hypothetical protein